MKKDRIKVWVLVSVRLAMGWMFFWTFCDKLLGLGFATEPAKSWMAGNSPTDYFLSNYTYGPLAGFYQSIAGHPVVDALFMAGLGLIGLSLLLGVGLRVAGYSGALMMMLMWSSMLPPLNNPVVDEHVIYAIVFLGLAYSDAGTHFGLGKAWSRVRLVKRWPWLQ